MKSTETNGHKATDLRKSNGMVSTANAPTIHNENTWRITNALVCRLQGATNARLSRRTPSSGQVVLEFTFCLIVVLLMIYGAAKVFLWAGKDLVERQKAHEDVLFSGGSQTQQITPDFFATTTKMNAIWVGD